MKGGILFGILITWVLGILCELTGIYVPDAEAGMYRSTKDRSNACRNRIRQKRRLDLRQFPVLIQHIRLGGNGIYVPDAEAGMYSVIPSGIVSFDFSSFGSTMQVKTADP